MRLYWQSKQLVPSFILSRHSKMNNSLCRIILSCVIKFAGNARFPSQQSRSLVSKNKLRVFHFHGAQGGTIKKSEVINFFLVHFNLALDCTFSLHQPVFQFCQIFRSSSHCKLIVLFLSRVDAFSLMCGYELCI